MSRRINSVAVAVLTVDGGDKVLQGAAVKGKCGGPLPLLVLLNGLRHQLFLKKKQKEEDNRLTSAEAKTENLLSLVNACRVT